MNVPQQPGVHSGSTEVLLCHVEIPLICVQPQPLDVAVSNADVNRAVVLLKEALKAVPNQYPNKEADVELLSFNERGPRLAVRPYTPTSAPINGFPTIPASALT